MPTPFGSWEGRGDRKLPPPIPFSYDSFFPSFRVVHQSWGLTSELVAFLAGDSFSLPVFHGYNSPFLSSPSLFFDHRVPPPLLFFPFLTVLSFWLSKRRFRFFSAVRPADLRDTRREFSDSPPRPSPSFGCVYRQDGIAMLRVLSLHYRRRYRRG